jgi:hypothetical protein
VVVAETDIFRFSLRRNSALKIVPLPPPEGDETTISSPFFYTPGPMRGLPFLKSSGTFGFPPAAPFPSISFPDRGFRFTARSSPLFVRRAGR